MSSLPNSGQLSLSEVSSEFGGGIPHNISEYFRNGVNVPDNNVNSSISTSGILSFSNFHSSSKTTISWNTSSGSVGDINYHARGLEIPSVSATSSSGGESYSVVSGALPTGGSLNGSGQIILGSNFSSDVTDNFTVRCTAGDGSGVFEDRAFSLTTKAEVTTAFSYTGGDQTWNVPTGVTYAQMEVLGAGGGSATSPGGTGGKAFGTRVVSNGQSYKIRVGEGGQGTCNGECSGNTNNPKFGGGGGAYEGNSGGGGTYIALSSMSFSNLVVVGGGAGGGGGGNNSNQYGGDGGGSVGQDGNGPTCVGGKGGTQSAGGTGTSCLNGGTFEAGSQMQGGDTHRSFSGGETYGGAGGGGYYGGSSGYRQGGWQHSGGGGGSGYVGGLTSATNTQGGGAGAETNGSATIKY